jgi:Protein of unknown function (DUF2442)
MHGMSSSLNETTAATVQHVRVTGKTLDVALTDGRTLSVPLGWYPRLAHGSPTERRRWRLIADGSGIHWPALDEDISVAGLLAGLPSGESANSLKRWLGSRRRLAKPLQPTSRPRRRPGKKRLTRTARG